MKVFISWSGDTSHKVAKVFRDWLPSVIQSVNPYVSSEDIDKGSRWSSDIAGELEESSYGILCVTKDNLNSPWLNFEAGALGKSVDKSKVSPFLFKLKRSEVDGPVLQFQSTILEKEDIFKLMKSINDSCETSALDENRLQKIFDVWWPSLEKDLNDIEDIEVEQLRAEEPEDKNNKIEELSNILENVLEISRTNQKLLRNPEQILPKDYLEWIMGDIPSRHNKRMLDIEPRALEEIIEHYRELLKLISKHKSLFTQHVEFEEIKYIIDRMDSPLRYVSKEMGMRLPRGLFEEEKI